MKNGNLKTFIILHKDKLKYISCILLLACGIVFASLATDLGINGVLTANRDIVKVGITNLEVKSGSVSASNPTIDNTKVEQTVSLPSQGDYYEYSFDITNNGTKDLMIDEVVFPNNDSKVTYTAKYEGITEIEEKDLLEQEQSINIDIKVEYTGEDSGSINNVDAGIEIKYVVADDNAVNPFSKTMILDDTNSNGVADEGEVISIDTEDFYVISNDGTNIKALAKWNLYVGNIVEDDSYKAVPISNPTGLQDESALGYRGAYGSTIFPSIGTIAFSSTNYWSSSFTSSPYTIDLIDSNNNIYPYLQDYKTALEEKGGIIEDITLITYEELETLGCVVNYDDYGICTNAPSWVYQTSYWSGSAYSTIYVWNVTSGGSFYYNYNYIDNYVGVRPVIEVLASNL